MAVGSMVKLDASDGDINTSDNLNMFEGYQKVFIANGANLKVADFINTKLTHTELTTAHAKGDILTQTQSEGNIASMVVDFTDEDSLNTYGYAYYAGTATAFDTSTAITGSGSGTGFTPTHVTDKPHWYDWTVYPGGESGSLPNKAYLGCLYRGRCILSGDPEHPYQWYASRQGNPWDFAYVAYDAGSPVAGGDSDAGETGDIIRALIPYKDDILVIGCSTSIWFLAGDPANGGSLNELDLTIGMFGAHSWCFDGAGNLYFWGTNGVYKTTLPGTPECISELSLPRIVRDEEANPATHRIIMAYDIVRTGLLISITKLSDGTSSSYFYDLKSQGFFPESYPDECGPYSSFFYDANDDDYRDLLIGCRDGYIRKFDETAKDDDIGVADEAIDSHVTFGPLPMSNNPKLTGKLTGLDCVTAGGASGGTQSDSDDITYSIFTGKSGSEVIENLVAGTNPDVAGTIKAPGRQRSNGIRRKIKGVYVGIKLENSTASETWGFEQLMADFKLSGRLK